MQNVNIITFLKPWNANYCYYNNHYFFLWQPPIGPRPPHYRDFTITLRHITLGRTPLDEWSGRRRDLFLVTQNTRNRQTSMPPAGLEPAIPASEWPQTHALDSAATGIGSQLIVILLYFTDMRLHVSTSYVVILRPFQYIKIKIIIATSVTSQCIPFIVPTKRTLLVTYQC